MGEPGRIQMPSESGEAVDRTPETVDPFDKSQTRNSLLVLVLLMYLIRAAADMARLAARRYCSSHI